MTLKMVNFVGSLSDFIKVTDNKTRFCYES